MRKVELSTTCHPKKPMGNSESVSSIERLDRIAAYIEEHKIVSVTELCTQFGVSQTTIRRVLDTLSEQERIQRVHGGARIKPTAPPESPVLQRSNEQAREKTRIGKYVASMIQDGETIFIGSGSTTFEVAKNLDRRAKLTVISNSLLVINELIEYPNIELISLGGIIRKSECSFIGFLAEQSLSHLRADRVIIGIHAINIDHGLTNDYLEETITDRTIIKNGKQVIIVADHSKCGLVSRSFVAPVEVVDIFVTGTETTNEFANGLTEKGVHVIRV